MTGFVHAVTAKAFAGFLFLAIVFGVGLFLIYRSVEGLNPAVQRIREPNKIVELWGDAIKNVNVAATYMRSYLLTVDPAMLEKFDAQRDTIASELDTLRLLSLNNPERSERADSLVILLDQKLEEMTLGVVASQGDAMSAAIDDAVKQLALLERKREQEEEVSTARDSVAPQPKAEEKKKKNFFQRIMLNKQKKKSADTDMDIVQLASMLDSIIVADTIAAVSDTVNHTLLIAEQLAEAKTKDYQNREVQLKDELRMLAQMRTTDSTIQALSTRMLRAEQEATADLIAQASTEVRKSSDYIITVLAGGAILLIVFFTVIIRRDVGRSAQLQRQIDQARINAEQLAKTREEFAANM
ncbi:MAG TPA: CHASE3 domain-containing protein, partial [Bacteroidia bacterium]|nr:CHASE3 domain-containing protein [Bacteroidia bacterium]